MAEDGAEHSNIKTPSVSAADNRSGIGLVSEADARSPEVEVLLDTHRRAEGADTGDTNIARGQIGEAALPWAIDGLRKVDLPTNPEIQSEVGSHTPAVLGVAEYPLLRFLRIGGGTYITGDVGGIAQQKGGEAQ